MDPNVSDSSESSGRFSASSINSGPGIDDFGFDDEQPMEVLENGHSVCIRVDQNSLLKYVMQSLGSNSEPVFTEIDCAQYGYKYYVKLDMSGLPLLTGEHLPFSIVEGCTSYNRETARTSAAERALKFLHEKHRIRVCDFSSRVASQLDSYNIFDLVIDGKRSVENVLATWGITLGVCEQFAVTIKGKKFEHLVAGELNKTGKLFELASESISDELLSICEATSEARSEFMTLQDDIRSYQRFLFFRGQRKLTKGQYQLVQVPSEYLLMYVLEFLQLEPPQYINRSGINGYVTSEVTMSFPVMERFHISGPITISGYGGDCAEANEHVSLEALLFIEKHFPIKIIDCNYGKRKKAMKQQDSLVSMLKKVIEIGQKVNKLWARLTHEIKLQGELFSLDTRHLSTCGMSKGESEAFNFVVDGFNNIGKQTSDGYWSCAPQFKCLQILIWKLHEAKSKLNK